MDIIKNDLTQQEIMVANEDNLVNYIRFLGELPGSALEEDQGLLRFTSNVPVQDLNWACSSALSAQWQYRLIKDTVDFYQTRSMPFCFYPLPSALDDLLEKNLNATGLYLNLQYCCMGIDLNEDEQKPEHFSGIEFLRVEGDQEIQDWVQVLMSAYQYPQAVWDPCINFVNSLVAPGNNPIKLYLAYLDGIAVGTSTVFTGTGVGGLYLISVTPDQRGKGVGTAVTRHALEVCAGLGYRYVVLQSSDMGRRLYQNVGFADHGSLAMYSL